MPRHAVLVILLSLGLLGTTQVARAGAPQPPARSENPEAKKDEKKDEKKDDKKPEELKVTTHETTIGGKSIKYTATAGRLPLQDDAGKTKANVFFVAYERDGQEKASRPVTFAFNGGPGSSSVWLHLGALGPRRVKMGPDGEAPTPPGTLVDNDQSWLDMTDLVFIDPVSTGFSRAVEGENASQFYGLDQDISSVGNFIRLYCTRYGRWASPKFLVGESYGTTRAAGLSGYLQDALGIYVTGIVMVSPVLNFQTIEFDIGNDTPYWLYVPTYCATAWYHQKLEKDLQGDLKKTVAEASAWASGEYLQALAKGDSLPDKDRDAIATKLARYLGVTKTFVLRCNLRVDLDRFAKELLRDSHRTVGRLDSRYKGIDRDDAGDSYQYDPSMSAITGPYTAGFNAYVRAELNYETDLNYEILSGRVHPWSFGASNRYANVADTLRGAMTRNPSLRVMFVSGYYDMATPFFAMEYTASHLGLDPGLRTNVTRNYYEAGHMMYIREADLKKLKTDAQTFYTATPAPTPALNPTPAPGRP